MSIAVSKNALDSKKAAEDVLNAVRKRDPDQGEFLQAVEEVLASLKPLFDIRPELISVVQAMCEPDRMVAFKVLWEDDNHQLHVNRGYRVQFNNTLGPYKGGLRLHPSVTLSVIKFLGFEQTFKNALTTLPLGGGKGGSDFDPKGKSDAEILRFCQAFMTQLYNLIGPDRDIPAGDIGVGAREIGFLYGQYRKLKQQAHRGVLTGKAPGWGGSLMRPQATGYGVVYFALNALRAQVEQNRPVLDSKNLRHMYSADNAAVYFKGKRCVVSGSGNVAQYCAEKLLEYGATVLTLSDSSGYIHMPDGLTTEGLEYVKKLKNVQRGRISAYVTDYDSKAVFIAKKKVWEVNDVIDFAFPCATQNEVTETDARLLVKAGCTLIGEGANMPCTNEAVHVLRGKSDLIYLPAKAANSGGVATSGLEMTQNSLRYQWTADEVDVKLQDIMANVFSQCSNTAAEYGRPRDYQFGANAAGFLKVANAMIDQGEARPVK